MTDTASTARLAPGGLPALETRRRVPARRLSCPCRSSFGSPLYWLGLTAIDAAVGAYIAFRLAYTDIRGDIPIGAATTLLTIGGAVLAIIVQPTVGSISDYAVTKWGRRKPYIVFGSLFDVLFLIGIANSQHAAGAGARS